MRNIPLMHFCDLAYAGRNDAASAGEIAARNLAQAILKFTEGLDAKAIEGAAEFLLKMPASASIGRELTGIDEASA